MYDDIMCPLIARNQLGDNVFNREVYTALRQVLDAPGNVINKLNACFELIIQLEKGIPLNFIRKSKATTESLIKAVSKWSSYADLCGLVSIIGTNPNADKISAAAYKGRHEQIANALLSAPVIDQKWSEVASVLVNLDKSDLLSQIVEKMPEDKLKNLLEANVATPLRDIAIKRYVREAYGVFLDIQYSAYIGSHPTISDYYPKYANNILHLYSGNYCSSKHSHSIQTSVALNQEQPDKLIILFSANKFSRGYAYNATRDVAFVFDLLKKELYKETKRGLQRVR